MNTKSFEDRLRALAPFAPVMQLDAAADGLLLMDFTAANTELNAALLSDTALFSAYVAGKIAAAGCRYGIGGYNEHRAIYTRSDLFGTNGHSPQPESRCIHLGIDIWAAAGTPVYAPMDGTVHSFAFNDQYGDYGPAIILRHEAGGQVFHSLYGHLSLPDLDGLHEGQLIAKGSLFAHLGNSQENGHWPPHLHFQLVGDIGDKKGDYPGVAAISEREQYLANCPDPDLVLQWMQLAKK